MPNCSQATGEKSETSQMPDRESGTPWLDVQGAAARAVCSDGTILREARAGRLYKDLVADIDDHQVVANFKAATVAFAYL